MAAWHGLAVPRGTQRSAACWESSWYSDRPKSLHGYAVCSAFNMSANNGLQSDPLFVAATRPPMRFGVTTAGMVLGAMVVIELFLWTGNLLWLLAYIPIHGLLALLLMQECRFFDLLTLWARTKGLNCWFLGNRSHWKASSYSPLRYDLSNLKGRRKPQKIFFSSNAR